MNMHMIQGQIKKQFNQFYSDLYNNSVNVTTEEIDMILHLLPM